MKKLITILIAGLFTLASYGQSGVIYGKGLKLNGATSGSALIMPPAIAGTNTKLIIAATSTTDTILTTKGMILGSTVFVKLLPDTAAYTDNFTLQLSDANRWISVTKATSVAITIPSNATVAIPIGTTINFIQGGAGVLVFKGAFHSFKDSAATDGLNSWAALYKRGINDWKLYGNIGQ